MRNGTLAALALLLATCDPPSTFRADQAEALCDLYESCGRLGDIGVKDWQGCYDLVSGVDDSCDDYDPDATDECLAGIEALTCATLDEGWYPTACDSVCGAQGS